jgi:hypothetical protein
MRPAQSVAVRGASGEDIDAERSVWVEERGLAWVEAMARRRVM